jgi:hypothetical protein
MTTNSSINVNAGLPVNLARNPRRVPDSNGGRSLRINRDAGANLLLPWVLATTFTISDRAKIRGGLVVEIPHKFPKLLKRFPENPKESPFLSSQHGIIGRTDACNFELNKSTSESALVGWFSAGTKSSSEKSARASKKLS